MVVEGKKVDNAYVIAVKGRMDTVTAPEFETACAQWIEQGERRLVVDCSELEYISSAGLRVLLTVARKLKPLEGSICFCAIPPMVEKVFTISGFNSLFAMHETVESALHTMQNIPTRA